MRSRLKGYYAWEFREESCQISAAIVARYFDSVKTNELLIVATWRHFSWVTRDSKYSGQAGRRRLTAAMMTKATDNLRREKDCNTIYCDR